MDAIAPQQPAIAGTGIRILMGVIAVIAFFAMIGAGALSLMAFVFSAVAAPSGYDAALLALHLVLIAGPLLCVVTTVIATIAAITGKYWAVWTASGLFVLMVLTTILLNLWIGAVG